MKLRHLCYKAEVQRTLQHCSDTSVNLLVHFDSRFQVE